MSYYTIEEHSLAATSSHDESSPAIIEPDNNVGSVEQTHISVSESDSLSTTPMSTTPISKCGSVGFSLGTPIEACDVDSPHGAAKSLPDRSLFAVGVSDHILYENLDNATGTFQRLREVIQSLHSSSSS